MDKCGLWMTIFRFHATDHERGQENLAFRFRANNVYDASALVSRLKGIGYRRVKFQKIGEVNVLESPIDS